MADLYAIAGDFKRALLMLKAEVPYLQLRFKDKLLAPYRGEIAQWPYEFPATRLIINDDLELAEAVRAWGAHLGQEDLLRYSRDALLGTSMHLGISTHSDEEIRHALEFSPALIGFGPMYATTTKQLTHAPQGAGRLREVVRSASVSVVAIGGITDANMDEVVQTGVAMVAMIGHLDGLADVEAIHALMARLKG